MRVCSESDKNKYKSAMNKIASGVFQGVVRDIKDPNLTENQLFSAKRYQGYSYDVNRFMRHADEGVFAWEDDGDIQDYEKVISSLREICNRTPLTEPLTVYRGYHSWDDVLFKDMKVGDVFTDKGFMSTSVNPHVASDLFTSTSGGGYLLVIHLPTTTKCYPLHFDRLHETEILLQHGTSLRILDTDHKDRIIHAEVV